MGRMTHVQRRANRYEFRFRIPEDLAGQPAPDHAPSSLAPLLNKATKRFKREIVRSLKTSDPQTAKRRALSDIAEAHRLVDEARRFLRAGPETGIRPDQVKALISAHETRLLSGDEKLRRAGLGLDLNRGSFESHSEGMTNDDLSLYQFTVSFLDDELRQSAARMRPSELIKAAVERAITERRIVLPEDDPARRELELGFLAAQRKAFDAVRGRLKGEIIETPAAPCPSDTITITEALEPWAAGGGRKAKRPREFSILEARRAVERFVQLHGNLPISGITKAHAREFRDAWAKVPKALPAKLQRLRLPELLKADVGGLPQRNAQTVNKILNLLSAICSRAAKDGYFDENGTWSNPFRVTFEISPTDREPYEPFTAEELRKLFASPVFASGERPLGGRGEAAYWLPVIALYSGARRTEIAQLRARDIRQSADGIWFFDFTAPDPDQHVKTMSSARVTPVHPELIRLGLLNYVQRRGDVSATAALWAEFEPPVAPKAKAWTKWFARYLGAHVTDDPRKTFHSLRHGFKRACRDAGIPEEIHAALTGHAMMSVGQRYGRERRDDGTLDRGVPLGRLALEIAKVDYALRIDAL